MLPQDFAHKNWLDDKNSEYALENYYDQLPEETKFACDLKAQLTLIGVKIETAKEIAAGCTCKISKCSCQHQQEDYHTLNGEPF